MRACCWRHPSRTRKAASSRSLTRRPSRVLEDGVPQTLDLSAGSGRGDVCSARRQQPEHVEANGFCAAHRDNAGRVHDAERPDDHRALRTRARCADRARPTTARPSRKASRPSRPTRGTAILDSLAQRLEDSRNQQKAGVRSCSLRTDMTSIARPRSTMRWQRVKSAGATVYVVGIGGVAGISIKGERLLRRLAVETGGRFFFPVT